MGKVIKFDSDFGYTTVIVGDYLSVGQIKDSGYREVTALSLKEAVKLAEWILENAKKENNIEEI